MTTNKRKIMAGPTALLLGCFLFGVGYCFRPSAVGTQAASVPLVVAASGVAPTVRKSSPSGAEATEGLAEQRDAESTVAATSPSHGEDANNAQTYQGKIISMNGVRFVLRTDESGTWYPLDDQQTAGKYLGKQVIVTGRLDTATDVIRIESIAEAKS
jgi:Protein of unknown function (DUF5818)